MLNLILSLIFVNVFPEEFKVVGVIVATIITTLLICDIVEPYVLCRHVFGASVKHLWLKNYTGIALFSIGLIALTFLEQKDGDFF